MLIMEDTKEKEKYTKDDDYNAKHHCVEKS